MSGITLLCFETRLITFWVKMFNMTLTISSISKFRSQLVMVIKKATFFRDEVYLGGWIFRMAKVTQKRRTTRLPNMNWGFFREVALVGFREQVFMSNEINNQNVPVTSRILTMPSFDKHLIASSISLGLPKSLCFDLDVLFVYYTKLNFRATCMLNQCI